MVPTHYVHGCIFDQVLVFLYFRLKFCHHSSKTLFNQNLIITSFVNVILMKHLAFIYSKIIHACACVRWKIGRSPSLKKSNRD